MPLYPFETQLVADANTPGLVLTNAVVTIYDPNDTGMTTPLALVNPQGLPADNPVTVTAQGFIPAFQAELPQVLWSGGGYSGYLNSFQGVLAAAEAAQLAAEAAAASAAGAAAGGPHTHPASDISTGTLDPARLPAVTTSAQGAMLAADKIKLNDATSAATASKLVIRDANGRAQFATPSLAADAATKGYVDGLASGGSAYEQSVQLLSGTANATANRTAIQAAIDAVKNTSGTVTLLPPGGNAYEAANAAFVDDRITHPSRVIVRSAAPNGVMIKAAANIPGDIWVCGATDETDTNWHYGQLQGVQFDGNKANNTQNSALTVTSVTYAASPEIPTVANALTLTTSVAHGYRIGDVVKLAGASVAGLNGEWVVLRVPTTTTFKITVNGASTMAGATGVTSRRLKNGVSVQRGGETAELMNVMVNNCADHGFYYGIQGVPMMMTNCSAFYNNGYGYSVWPDRPLTMVQPSGDGNTLGLLGVQGSSGVATGQSALTVINMKAEFLTVPAVTFTHWDGSAVFVGGAVEMSSGNTAPAFRRIGTGNGRIKFLDTRVDMRNTGTATVFNDQNAAYSRQTSHIYAFSYTDDIGPDTHRCMTRWDYLGGTTPTPYIDNAATWWLAVANATAVTVQAPTSYVPQFDKDVQTITILVQNTSAAAISVSFVSNYKIEGWTPPAAGKAKLVTFKHIAGVTGTNWYCQSISPDFTP